MKTRVCFLRVESSVSFLVALSFHTKHPPHAISFPFKHTVQISMIPSPPVSMPSSFFSDVLGKLMSCQTPSCIFQALPDGGRPRGCLKGGPPLLSSSFRVLLSVEVVHTGIAKTVGKMGDGGGGVIGIA